MLRMLRCSVGVGDKWQDTDSQDFDAAAIASSRDKQVSRDGKVSSRATGGLSTSLRLGDSGEYRVAVTDASRRVGVWSLSDIGAVSDVQVRDYAPSNIGFSTDNKTWQAQGATGWMKFDDAPLLHVAVHNEGSFVARNEVTVNGVPVVSDDIGFDAKRSAQSGYEVNIYDLVATKKVRRRILVCIGCRLFRMVCSGVLRMPRMMCGWILQHLIFQVLQ